MRVRVGGLVIAGAMLVVACASITGADQLYVGGEGAGGGASSSSGNSSGSDAALPGTDAGDGDGGVDPPLPQCSAGVCVPTADGWSPATWPGFFGAGQCPDGWPTRTEYKSAGAFTCDCACTPNAGSCEGPLLVAGGGFTCSASPTPLPTLPSDGSCVETKIDVSIGSAAKVTSTPASPPTACIGAPKPIGGGTDTIPLCSGVASTASAQCAPTESCVPSPGKGAETCIVHDGAVACPQGFGRRMEVTAGAVKDTRRCSSTCTCDPSCNGGRIEAFFDSSCTTALGATNLGECAIATLGQGSSFRYVAGNGCVPAQRPTVQGTVTLDAPKTVCCARGGF